MKKTAYLFFCSLLVAAQLYAAPDTCTLKASFYPRRDTVVSTDFTADFNSNTIGAQKINWLFNGTDAGSTGSVHYTVKNTGINEIALVATNGACIDTAFMYVVVTGVKPSTHDYRLSIGKTGIQSQAFSIARMNTEEAAIGGYIEYPLPDLFISQKKGFISAVSDDGCIRWSKQSRSAADTNNIVTQIKKMHNGDLLAAFDARLLVRFDGNGKQLWAKSFPKIGISQPTFSDFFEDNDNNIIVLNSGAAVQTIEKMDAAGNKIWSRSYTPSLNYQVLTWYSLTQNGNSYYVCGTVVDNITGPGIHGRSLMAKLDMNDGSVQWMNSISVANCTQVQVYNNSLLISAGSGATLLYFDFDGSYLKGYTLKFDAGVAQGPNSGTVLSRSDGDLSWFVLGQAFTSTQGILYYSNFMLLHNDQIVLQQTLHNTSNDRFYSITEGKEGSILGAGNAAGQNDGNSGPLNASVLKAAITGISSTCDISSLSNTLVTATVVTQVLTGINESVSTISMTDEPLVMEDITMQRSWLCNNAVDSCSLLKIKGRRSVCDLGQDYTYRIHKSGSCGISISATSGVKIKNVTDTTVTVSFIKGGLQSIKLSMPGACNPLADSIIVNAGITPGSFSIGNDTIICKGSVLQLDAGPGFMNYKWQDGSTNRKLYVTDAGIYSVKVSDSCGNTATDTLIVSIAPYLIVDLIPDATICHSDSVIFKLPQGFSGFSVSPQTGVYGSAASGQLVIKPATNTAYQIALKKNTGCDAIDSSTIKFYPDHSPHLGNDTALCGGQKITFNVADNNYTSYQWSTGSTAPEITVSTRGVYSVMVTDENKCVYRDTVAVNDNTVSPPRFLHTDTSICSTDTLILSSSLPFKQYRWSTGAITSSIPVNKPGVYSLQVTDQQGCNWTQSMKLGKADCLEEVFFPSAFTPNNDGINDVFRPKTSGRMLSFHMDIYNRWGQKIFESDDSSKGWDGTRNRTPQDGGVYVWVAKLHVEGHDVKTQTGTVVLIR